MAVKRPTLSGEILEGLSKVLGDTSNGLSNNEITKYLKATDRYQKTIVFLVDTNELCYEKNLSINHIAKSYRSRHKRPKW